MDCIFCEIIKGNSRAYIVHEDDETIALLDKHPINRGHTLVIPKAHYENVFDIPEEALGAVATTIKKVSTQLKENLKADGVNILNASGKAAQQSVFHLHFHLVPREEHDGLDAWISLSGTSLEPQNEYEELDFKGVLKQMKGDAPAQPSRKGA